MSIDIECEKAKKIVKEMCDEEVGIAFTNFIRDLQLLCSKYTESMVVESCTDFVVEVVKYGADDQTVEWFKNTFNADISIKEDENGSTD